MYISLLDYLEEIKKKFYVIILMILLFLIISVGYKFVKDDHKQLSYSTNLIKLSGLTLSQYNFEASSQLAIEWIGDEAISRFNEKNKIKNLKMKCEKELSFLKCRVSGKIKNNIDEIKNVMYLSILGAFDDYELYVVDIIEELISSKQDLFGYVENFEDAEIETKASYKGQVKEIIFTKELFLDLINRVRIMENEITISQINTKINYFFLILSAVISGLFLIFLQMTSKTKLS